VAEYLRPWYPDAEKTPNSRKGRDILGTPGLALEVKTSGNWSPGRWLEQAMGYQRHPEEEVAALVYFPPGVGQAKTGLAMVMLPFSRFMDVAQAGGYAPPPGHISPAGAWHPGRAEVCPLPGACKRIGYP
jgi:hypothetical protein